jgi:hypothetical protein
VHKKSLVIMAESPLSQSNIFVSNDRQLCGRSLSQHKLQVKFKKLKSIAYHLPRPS